MEIGIIIILLVVLVGLVLHVMTLSMKIERVEGSKYYCKYESLIGGIRREYEVNDEEVRCGGKKLRVYGIEYNLFMMQRGIRDLDDSVWIVTGKLSYLQ